MHMYALFDPMSIPNVVDILDSISEIKCYINVVSKEKIIIIKHTRRAQDVLHLRPFLSLMVPC